MDNSSFSVPGRLGGFAVFALALAALAGAAFAGISPNGKPIVLPGANHVLGSCQALGIANANYVLLNDIAVNTNVTPHCFNVTASNITLDCKGYKITALSPVFGSYAVKTLGIGGPTMPSTTKKFTLKNCIIENFDYGAHIFRFDYSSATNNTFIGNSIGVYAYQSHNLTVSGNTIRDGRSGISASSSSSVLIASNRISGSGTGISYGYGSRPRMEGNTANMSTQAGTGMSLSSSQHGIFRNNNMEAADGLGLEITHCGYTSNALFQGNSFKAKDAASIRYLMNTVMESNSFNGMLEGVEFNTINWNNTFQKNSIVSQGGDALAICINQGYANDDCKNNRFYNNSIFAYAGGRGLSARYAVQNQIKDNAIVADASNVAIYLGAEAQGNALRRNNVSAGQWVECHNANNTFSDSVQGNRYYFFSNFQFLQGFGAWTVYNIIDLNLDGWADSGTDLPFNATVTPGHWAGLGYDAHPYVFTTRKL